VFKSEKLVPQFADNCHFRPRMRTP